MFKNNRHLTLTIYYYCDKEDSLLAKSYKILVNLINNETENLIIPLKQALVKGYKSNCGLTLT